VEGSPSSTANFGSAYLHCRPEQAAYDTSSVITNVSVGFLDAGNLRVQPPRREAGNSSHRTVSVGAVYCVAIISVWQVVLKEKDADVKASHQEDEGIA
jgi:hypothetical protein